MLRALKKSFTCTGKQRKNPHSRSRNILLHMAECRSPDNFDANETNEDDPKIHESRPSRRNNSICEGEFNNSMNDWQEVVTALKNVDHSSSEKSESIKALVSEDDPTTSKSSKSHQDQVSNAVASRLTPSAAPLRHRKSSFNANNLEIESGDERFISEYNVRLEPVIKICIPCQHDHAQCLASIPTAKITSDNSTVTTDVDVNSNSADMMCSIKMAAAELAMAVKTPDSNILADEIPAGDESSKCKMVIPPRTPECKATTASPTQDNVTNLTAGDPCSLNAVTTAVPQAAAAVEVGEWVGDKSPTEKNEIDAKIEAEKMAEEEDKELFEPAPVTEIDPLSNESQILITPDRVDTMENDPKEEREVAISGDKELKSKEKKEKENTKEKEDEEGTTFEVPSKDIEYERDATPTSVSFTNASFVDVYDKEPLHPIDDSKTTVNPLQRIDSTEPTETPKDGESSEHSVARPAPWLGAKEPTSSADRWKRMKQIVKDRELAALAHSSSGESLSSQVDLRLKKFTNSLSHSVQKSSDDENDLEVPINAELRHILQNLATQSKKSIAPEKPKPRSSKLRILAPTTHEAEKNKTEQQNLSFANPKIVTSPLNDKKQRFSFQMELDSNDAVVSSFLRPTDRRVVVAASKNNCTINVSAARDHASKIVMHKSVCVVEGATRDQVARCINFLKDTFPKSNIRFNR